MNPHTPTAHEVETFTGRYVDTERPDPATVTLEDIAHALSQTCRYGGHTDRFYSVAEHAVLVSRRLEEIGQPRFVQIAGLHHDDAEAYLGDIPRPLKIHLGQRYKTLSKRMDEAIACALRNEGVAIRSHDFHHEAVKEADTWALFVEARHMLPSKGVNWSGAFEDWDIAESVEATSGTPAYWKGGINPARAKAAFLARHKELCV